MFKSYKEYLKNTGSDSVSDSVSDNVSDSVSDNVSDDYNTIETLEDKPDFYEWLLKENTNMSSYIQEASKIIDLFDISSYDNLELYDNIKLMNGPINRKRLIEVMEKENFIFIN